MSNYSGEAIPTAPVGDPTGGFRVRAGGAYVTYFHLGILGFGPAAEAKVFGTRKAALKAVGLANQQLRTSCALEPL